MGFMQLKSVFHKFCCCRFCDGKLDIADDELKCMGFAILTNIFCDACNFKESFYSSPGIIQQHKRGNNSKEVNYRAVMAFREISRGYGDVQLYNE